VKILLEIDDSKLAEKILTILSLFREEGLNITELPNVVENEKANNLTFSDGVKEVCATEFLNFLNKIYRGKENISELSDEEALEDALRDKYGL